MVSVWRRAAGATLTQAGEVTAVAGFDDVEQGDQHREDPHHPHTCALCGETWPCTEWHAAQLARLETVSRSTRRPVEANIVLDLRSLQATIVAEDDTIVLVLRDDAGGTVLLHPGASEQYHAAISGAQQCADTALLLVADLSIRAAVSPRRKPSPAAAADSD